MLQGSSLNKIDQRRHATRLSRVTSSVGWRRSQETGHLTFFIFDIALLFPVPILGLPIASCPHKHNTLNTLPSLLGLLLLFSTSLKRCKSDGQGIYFFFARQSASMERLTSLGVYQSCAPPELTAFRASSLRSTLQSATRMSRSGTLSSMASKKLLQRSASASPSMRDFALEFTI